MHFVEYEICTAITFSNSIKNWTTLIGEHNLTLIFVSWRCAPQNFLGILYCQIGWENVKQSVSFMTLLLLVSSSPTKKVNCISLFLWTQIVAVKEFTRVETPCTYLFLLWKREPKNGILPCCHINCDMCHTSMRNWMRLFLGSNE